MYVTPNLRFIWSPRNGITLRFHVIDVSDLSSAGEGFAIAGDVGGGEDVTCSVDVAYVMYSQ